jgi:hypothetical protein
MRHCEACGTEMHAQRRGAKYCTPGCRLTAHRRGTTPESRRNARLSVSTPPVATPLRPTSFETHKRPRLHPLIVPDAKWSGMYRIRKPDGTLTDMLNLTRAKDALAEASRS